MFAFLTQNHQAMENTSFILTMHAHVGEKCHTLRGISKA